MSEFGRCAIAEMRCGVDDNDSWDRRGRALLGWEVSLFGAGSRVVVVAVRGFDGGVSLGERVKRVAAASQRNTATTIDGRRRVAHKARLPSDHGARVGHDFLRIPLPPLLPTGSLCPAVAVTLRRRRDERNRSIRSMQELSCAAASGAVAGG